MLSVPADLSIEARWIVPMTVPGKVLENHTLVIRDGRIVDLLPTETAAARHTATATVRRSAHLLMPGMINTATNAARSLFRGIDPGGVAALEQRFAGPEFVRDGVLTAVAEMLCSGVTCFADRYYFPDECARAVALQGMRAIVGTPVAETPSLWAKSSDEYFSRALRVHDEYKDHPLISTAFAPLALDSLSDATCARIATLADELDARIVVNLNGCAGEIAASLERHGMRPMTRLWELGLLTPALHAVHVALASPEDIELAGRTGVSIGVCPTSSLAAGSGLPPIAEFAASGIRLGLCSADEALQGNYDVWGEMKLSALAAGVGASASNAWNALSMATRGGAAALGLDTEVGTLESGKWADLCCVDLSGPATQPLRDPVTQLVFGGGRDMVSDVWVAGRQLLSDGEMTRLDWPGVADRTRAWAARLTTGV
jgi:5-methylthioadenosine/S-adenosylhomocysteine deaminase